MATKNRERPLLRLFLLKQQHIPEMRMNISPPYSITISTTLAKLGTPERIFMDGMGEYQWIADNSTREGRLLNHRIEIRISPLI